MTASFSVIVDDVVRRWNNRVLVLATQFSSETTELKMTAPQMSLHYILPLLVENFANGNIQTYGSILEIEKYTLLNKARSKL